MTHNGEGRRPDVEAKPRQIDASLRKFQEPQQVTKKALPTTARITILIALKCNGIRAYSFMFFYSLFTTVVGKYLDLHMTQNIV